MAGRQFFESGWGREVIAMWPNYHFQGDVTSIGAVLPPTTGVKNFDRQFFTLTLDFVRKKLLTVDPMHYNFNRSAGPAHVTRHVTSL